MQETGDKNFKIQDGNRHEIVSADRLKPANLDDNLPIQVDQTPTRVRSKQKHQQPKDNQTEQIFSSEYSYGRKRKQTVFYNLLYIYKRK